MEEKDFRDVLKKIAPGTTLRIALNDILSAGMGALIIVDNEIVEKIIEVGFSVNQKLTSQKIVELAKMDGAIILSSDLKTILYANTLVIPDPGISTTETGTRHKAGERAAKQAKTIVIVVSERKRKITLYCDSYRQEIEKTSEILRKVSETLQILEKQREVYDNLIENLNLLEFSGFVSAIDVSLVLQRIEMINRVSEQVKRYLIELGAEGKLVDFRFRDLLKGIDKEKILILRDYFLENHLEVALKLKSVETDLLFQDLEISKFLFNIEQDMIVTPKGFRLLSKINFDEKFLDIVFGNFLNFNEILKSIEDGSLLVFLEGSEVLFKVFKDEVLSLKEKVRMGKRI